MQLFVDETPICRQFLYNDPENNYNQLKNIDYKAEDLITAITSSWNQAIIKTIKVKKARKNWPKHIRNLKEKLVRLQKKKNNNNTNKNKNK